MDNEYQEQTRRVINRKGKRVANNNTLCVLHLNIQSISNKQTELDLVLKSDLRNIDVLCFTEHWIKEDYLNLIQIEQYKLVSEFSRKMYDHGGSCIYVKKGIRTKELNCFTDISVEKEFEMSATELVDFGFIIVCIYRPPDSNFWTFLKILESTIQIAQEKEKKLLMCGDWNVNFMLNNTRIDEVKNLLGSYGLQNIVRFPTRITPKSESLLDVIVINKYNLKLEVSVIDLGFSDHLAQVANINIGKINMINKTQMRRQLTMNNIDKLKQLLYKESWNTVLHHLDVNVALKEFMHIFLHCLETAIPYKKQKLRKRRNKRWLSKGLIKSSKKMKMLNNLKRRCTLTEETLEYIKKYRTIYKRVIREAKRRDNDRYVTEASNSTKAIWQVINKQIGKSQDEDYKFELKVDNNIMLKPMEITEKLNKHFTNTVTELVQQNINKRSYNNVRYVIKHCSKSIFLFPVTEEEVVSLTKKLKNKITAGYDDIPESLVKQCIQLIKKPLTFIYNLSLSSGVFPDEWKTAIVKPLYKKGDRYDIQNYRPISLISVFAKLLEKLMFNRLIPFIYENRILTENQNGFRKGRCIETAVQSFIEKIQETLDKGLFSIGIFLDLTKAYDTLNHEVLLEKLSIYGIRGITNLWFESYLTNRRQCVEINQSDLNKDMINRYRSSCREIKQGVPQGSVLGPLLFLLYINDLPLNVHGANMVMFADDINTLITDKDACALQIKIDRVMTELEIWLNRNDLIINIEKTGIMSFHNRQVKFPIKPQVTLNKINLEYTTEVKFLGIYITETLKWDTHIQILANKLSKVSFMIKSLKGILSPYMIRNIYFTKFQALLRFGILFWGGRGRELNKRIFRIQKRVIRLMSGVRSRTSCRQLFKELNILTLASLYIFEITCFIRKYCQSLEQNYQVHQHNTRRKLDIHVKTQKTELYKKSVINMGTRVYNNLPKSLKEINDYKVFKKELKIFLLFQSFYSVEEFIST